MDWRNQLVFLAAFVLVQLTGGSHGALDSSPAIAFKFGQCMIEKLSQSPLFSAEDKDSLRSIAVVLYDGLRRVTDNENGFLLNKALLSAFITSLCEIALDEEFTSSQFRRRELLISAEKCSLAVIGEIDANFFREITRIFFALRGPQVPVFSTNGKAASNAQGSLPPQSSQITQTFLPQQASVAPLMNSQKGSTSFPYSSDAPRLPSFPPEELIANILLNSPVFSNVFHSGIPNQDAISIARAIAEKAMTGFNPIVKTDASNFAANAVAMRSPNWNATDFAIAISRSISEVVKHYGIPLSAHASRIGNIMVSDLQAHFGSTRFSNVNSQGMQEQMQQAFATGESFATSVQSRPPSSPPLAIITIPTDDQPSFRVQESNIQNNTSSLKDMATSAVSFTGGDSITEEEISTPVLNKEFILSQCLLMARTALSPYGIDAINKAVMEIKNQFQNIPDGSPYPTYADAFSRALINTLVAQNLMGIINPEQLSKSMLEVLSSQEDSSGMPTKLEMQAPQIIPAPVVLEEPRSEVPSSSEDIGTEFINSQGMRLTEAPLVPINESSLKTEDTSTIETQLESSSAISKVESVISQNQQKEFESLPVNFETVVESRPTVMQLDTNASMQNFTFMMGEFPVQDMFPTTTFDGMSTTKDSDFLFTNMPPQLESSMSTTKDSDFLFTNMPPQLESSIEPADGSFEDETVLKPNEHDFPEASESVQSPETEVGTVRENNQQKTETDGSETPALSEAAETPTEKDQSMDLKPISSDVSQPNKTSSSVDLQPSFQSPMEQGHQNTEDYENVYEEFTESPPETATDYELEDPTIVFAREIVSISASAVSYIRESVPFDLNQLCANLNRLAPIVDIPPLTYCSEIALIDYILNIMMEVTKILRNI